VAEFVLAVKQYRDKFIPARLEDRILVHVDHLDPPAMLSRDGLERSDKVVTEVAPLPTQHGKYLAPGHSRHFSTLKLT